MPELQRNNVDDIKAVLQYFDISLNEVDVQPQTHMINVTRKGDQVEGIFNLINSSIKTNPNYKSFLGLTAEQRALNRQWVDYLCHNVIQNRFQSHKILAELDAALARTTFFAGHSISVCDVLFYYCLHKTFETMTFEEKEKYVNLSRWFSTVQDDEKLRQSNRKVPFIRTTLYG